MLSNIFFGAQKMTHFFLRRQFVLNTLRKKWNLLNSIISITTKVMTLLVLNEFPKSENIEPL